MLLALFSNQDVLHSSGPLLLENYSLTLKLSEFIVIALLVFQIGFYLGKKSLQKEFFSRLAHFWTKSQPLAIQSRLFTSQTQPLSSSANQIPENQDISRENSVPSASGQASVSPPPSRKQSHSSDGEDPSLGLALMTDAANKKPLDPVSIENMFFKEKIPFNSEKTSTHANFKVLFQNKGKLLYKKETYQLVTSFEKQPSVEAEYITLKNTIKRFSQKQINEDNAGFQIVLNRKAHDDVTEVLFKSLTKEPERPIIQVTGLCQNGKFTNMFVDVKKIGEGGFGCVYRATNKIQNKQYAIKKIYLTDVKNNDFLKQVTIVSHLSHAYIVRYYTWWIEEVDAKERVEVQKQYQFTPSSVGFKRPQKNNEPKLTSEERLLLVSNSDTSNGIYFQNAENSNQVSNQPLSLALIDKEHKKAEPDSPYKKKSVVMDQRRSSVSVFALHIQMELCESGSLAQYLKTKRREVIPALAFSLFDQVMIGLEVLHQNGIIHRDLKPGNIFMNKKEGVIKIGDFGLSTIIPKDGQDGFGANRRLGTPSYMAPQLFGKGKIEKPELLDVYSLGIIYYQLLTSFNTDSERVQKLQLIKEGQVQLNSAVEHERKLIRGMTRNARSRMSVKQVQQSQEYQFLKKKYGSILWADMI